MNRDSFVFYRSFYEAIKNQDDKTISNLFKAICEYALNHNEIELNGIEDLAFQLIKPQLEANFKKALNGYKGGIAKGKQTEANGKQKIAKPKQKIANGKQNEANVNVNVNDNVNVNVNDKCKYGEYSHVLLTEKEKTKLDEKYPNSQELIQFLDSYMEDRPDYAKKHKSHYRCIENWVVEAVEEKKKKKGKDIVIEYNSNVNKPLTDEELKSLKEFRNAS